MADLVHTRKAFLEDAYLSALEAKIIAVSDEGIQLDATNFYANSGGQPGDIGHLECLDGNMLGVTNTTYSKDKKTITHQVDASATALKIGDKVICHIDWERRYKLMQMHSACHLLSVVCPFPITSANVGIEESRVDFDLQGASFDKQEVTEKLMEMVTANYPIFTRYITQNELLKSPEIVKSKNVKPPMGMGDIRLVCIGENALIDSQPCGGTHVSETQEIGDIHIGKIENKGKANRRFRILFGKQL